MPLLCTIQLLGGRQAVGQMLICCKQAPECWCRWFPVITKTVVFEYCTAVVPWQGMDEFHLIWLDFIKQASALLMRMSALSVH